MKDKLNDSEYMAKAIDTLADDIIDGRVTLDNTEGRTPIVNDDIVWHLKKQGMKVADVAKYYGVSIGGIKHALSRYKKRRGL